MWLWRGGTDLVCTGAGVVDRPALASLAKAITTPGAMVAYQAFGAPTMTYAWTAPLQIKGELDKIAYARQIGDQQGERFAQTAVVQCGTMAAGGAAFAGYRSTAIACAVKRVSASGFSAPTMLGRVSYCFLFVGIVFFTLYYLLLAAVLGVKTVYMIRLQKQLEKAENKLAFLQAQMETAGAAAQLTRLVGKEAIQLIQNGDVSAVSKVAQILQSRKRVYAEMIILCLAAAAFTVLGLILTTGVGALICAIGSIFIILKMIQVDHAAWKESLSSTQPAKFDKIVVMISVALCFASVATVLGLAAAGLIIASPYVLMATALLSLIWMAYNLKTLQVIKMKEAQGLCLLNPS
jgi:hypothetical protein